MEEPDVFLWRVERLQAAIDRLDDGNLNAFGRRMGWSDGSYVGQMLRGARAISEKFIRKFEDLTGLKGWFDIEMQAAQAGDPAHEIRMELLRRDVPDHVLRTILELIKHCPPRNRVA